jgi:hypothetical protein
MHVVCYITGKKKGGQQHHAKAQESGRETNQSARPEVNCFSILKGRRPFQHKKEKKI